MKKITNRSMGAVIIAFSIIIGMFIYTVRYVNHGESWALFFSGSYSGAKGAVYDRTGTPLAVFDGENHSYADRQQTRMSCYHVVGDFGGRVGSSVLQDFRGKLQGYNLITGVINNSREPVELWLSVDAGLSECAYNAMKSRGNKGAVMVMNYKTGEVVCMVSLPTLDPAENTTPQEGVFVNRCLNASFTPGSVFKLITAAAAIEKLDDIDEKEFYCDGGTTIAGVPIKCSGVHYTVDFESALAHSCNSAFANIAAEIGQKTLYDYVKKYGFLSEHNLDSMTSVAGSFPGKGLNDAPETAWAGIGQSTDLICPYSMLRFVAAIANDGFLYEPTLIKDNNTGAHKLINPSTAKRLKEMMGNNVNVSYNPAQNFAGLDMYAKTGTAEVGDGSTHAWFTGFIEDEEHPLAFVVVMEKGGGGLSVAGDIAGTVIHYAVKNM